VASDSQTLADLIAALQLSESILRKLDIQAAAKTLGQTVQGVDGSQIRLGDDCAVIPNGDDPESGYLLLAAEGIWPQLLAQDPWFAGWCAVMVNLSDIAAMGGTAIAVVNALWSQSVAGSRPVWEGMQAASKAYGVPIVGGHINCDSDYDGLAVAVMGRSQQVLTSFAATPGDALIMVINMQGAYYKAYPFWNAATTANPAELRSHLSLLPVLAQSGLCHVAKDISMGGLAGTLLMLCEASGCGANLQLDQVPKPEAVDWEKWLTSFPSYGFLLSAPVENMEAIQALFAPEALVCAKIGEIVAGPNVSFQLGQAQQRFWNLSEPLTGFGNR